MWLAVGCRNLVVVSLQIRHMLKHSKIKTEWIDLVPDFVAEAACLAAAQEGKV